MPLTFYDFMFCGSLSISMVLSQAEPSVSLWCCLLLEANVKRESNVIIGLVIFFAVAIAVIAIVAVSALVHRRVTGQPDSI